MAHDFRVQKQMFKMESCDWKQYRGLPNIVEVDFHHSDRRLEHVPYRQAMENGGL